MYKVVFLDGSEECFAGAVNEVSQVFYIGDNIIPKINVKFIKKV